jgi:hypothetical protein
MVLAYRANLFRRSFPMSVISEVWGVRVGFEAAHLTTFVEVLYTDIFRLKFIEIQEATLLDPAEA